ncbi:MAG: helix-turn-helix domain-containing protein [Candidatus Onthovivens sp.]|nr:helix-turn-helix domain-containing protein [Candidatus Onthovivens sp.]
MTIKELQQFLKIGRNSAYDLVNRKEFKVLRVGKSIRINKVEFLRWFDNAC